MLTHQGLSIGVAKLSLLDQSFELVEGQQDRHVNQSVAHLARLWNTHKSTRRDRNKSQNTSETKITKKKHIHTGHSCKYKYVEQTKTHRHSIQQQNGQQSNRVRAK